MPAAGELRLEPQGEADPPDFKQIREGGSVRVQMPDNIFSAVIMYHANLMSEESPNLPGTFLSFVYMCTVALQSTMAYVLHDAVLSVQGDLTDTCDDTSTLAKFCAVTVFVAYAFKDIFETYDMHVYISYLRSSFDYDGSDGGALFIQSFKDLASRLPDDRIITRPVGDIKHRCVLLNSVPITVTTPKLAVAAFVLAAGSGAILRASNEFDVVLNTVAATFLLEIDDVAYALFVPKNVKRRAGNAPVLGLSYTEEQEYWVSACLRYLSPLLLTVAVLAMDGFLMYGYWCTEAAPGTPFYAGGGD